MAKERGQFSSVDTNITKRIPVFTDTRGVPNLGLASVVLNRGLNRYLLTVGHGRDPAGAIATAGSLGVFDAPEPWELWTTVAYSSVWQLLGDASEALVNSISTKRFAEDGRGFRRTISATNRDLINLIRGILITVEPIND